MTHHIHIAQDDIVDFEQIVRDIKDQHKKQILVARAVRIGFIVGFVGTAVVVTKNHLNK